MQFLLDADKAWLLLKLTFLSENQRWFFGLADLMSLCGENSVKEKGPFEAKMQTPFPNYSQWYCVKSYLSTLCRIFSKIQPERHPITPNHPYIYIYVHYVLCLGEVLPARNSYWLGWSSFPAFHCWFCWRCAAQVIVLLDMQNFRNNSGL